MRFVFYSACFTDRNILTNCATRLAHCSQFLSKTALQVAKSIVDGRQQPSSYPHLLPDLITIIARFLSLDQDIYEDFRSEILEQLPNSLPLQHILVPEFATGVANNKSRLKEDMASGILRIYLHYAPMSKGGDLLRLTKEAVGVSKYCYKLISAGGLKGMERALARELLINFYDGGGVETQEFLLNVSVGENNEFAR